MSKGSARRPQTISQAEMDKRWSEAFGIADHNEGGEQYKMPNHSWLLDGLPGEATMPIEEAFAALAKSLRNTEDKT